MATKAELAMLERDKETTNYVSEGEKVDEDTEKELERTTLAVLDGKITPSEAEKEIERRRKKFTPKADTKEHVENDLGVPDFDDGKSNVDEALRWVFLPGIKMRREWVSFIERINDFEAITDGEERTRKFREELPKEYPEAYAFSHQPWGMKFLKKYGFTKKVNEGEFLKENPELDKELQSYAHAYAQSLKKMREQIANGAGVEDASGRSSLPGTLRAVERASDASTSANDRGSNITSTILSSSYSENTIARGKRDINSVVDSAIQQYHLVNGPKSATKFSNLLAEYWEAKCQPSDFNLFFAQCKKVPMLQSTFDKVVEEDMKRSFNNMSNNGVSSEKINDSAPRKNFKENAIKMKEALNRIFWCEKLPDQAMNWSSYLLIPSVQHHAKMIRERNLTFKPREQPAIYSNAYWATASFASAYGECMRRFLIVEELLVRAAGKVETNVRGQVTKSSDTWLGELDTKYDTQPINTLMPAEYTKLLKEVSTNTLLNWAILPDVRKCLQTSEFAQGNVEQKKQLNIVIGKLMAQYVFLHKIWIKETITRNVSVNTFPRSQFGQMYFAALNFLHAFIRSAKNLAYGKKNSLQAKLARARDRQEDDSFSVDSLLTSNMKLLKENVSEIITVNDTNLTFGDMLKDSKPSLKEPEKATTKTTTEPSKADVPTPAEAKKAASTPEASRSTPKPAKSMTIEDFAW